MSAIEIETVDKSFGKTSVLRGISLSIRSGEFVAVLGPSGCGKTTLLRALAGFEPIDRGSIRIGDTLLSGKGRHVAPEERGIGVVFQSYALWPHMTVSGNVAYGLKIKGLGRGEREQRTARVLETVGLTEFAGRRPAALSGGQRQRVALARCLAMDAGLVLLDEPLANLDVHLRGEMEEEFARFHKTSGATMFYITHDQSEALALADRVAVMDKGRISQFASPSELYSQPANDMVATFIGEGQIAPITDFQPDRSGYGFARFFGEQVRVRSRPSAEPRATARVAFHPGDLKLSETGGLGATIRRITYRGDILRVELSLGPDEHTFFMNVPAPARIETGQRVAVTLADGWVLPDPKAEEASH
ncbi:ABC transporter ATP-binding protein [Martelella radicis]|uniref:Iron(III) transport system ATP-binding protein n=1 Tax=Martelella radicis TaxID=1397476 RepID=A0A7W6KFH8_9HYPH|nr:ABC transporter ATP-binding protein [Martelella radicis]MBB4120148.1 iron(III) transport system ATP-binding protein [Martelella radicis]